MSVDFQIAFQSTIRDNTPDMPEEIRALIVILVFAIAFFLFARKTACSFSSADDFTRRRNIWFLLTIMAFVAHNFWIYASVAITALLVLRPREKNPVALFFFILFVLPVASIEIPGIGPINYFFELSHARILELCILLPAFLSILRQSDAVSFGRTGPDKALACYLLLTAVLFLRDPNITNNSRQVFGLFIDVFLPYFVISRSLQNLQAFRDALVSLVLGISVVALLASFEFSKSWLLYSAVSDALGLTSKLSAYLSRDGMLRAVVTTGQPIALGYLMVTGMGLYLFLQRSIQQKLARRLGMALLAAGLIASLSRGPWLGAVVLLVVFISTGRHAARRLMELALVAIVALPLISTLPSGQKVMNLLPFVGSTDKENVDYRERLITNSMIVIERNPWLGSNNYLTTPEMESMRQGQGIIDIVNTYINVALDAGLIGLGMFVAFFALALHGTYRAFRSIPDKDSDEYQLGRALFATLIAMLIIIFTVSSIAIIPIMYWSVAGLAVAYAQMIRKNRASVAT